MALEQIPYEIITQHAERFTYTLELAIRFGKVLIVDDCNEIKSPLLSIISAVIQVRFNKKFVQVGNKLVDFNDNFKLILASTSATHLTPKPGIIDAFITVIPFTTTNAGLTGAMLIENTGFLFWIPINSIVVFDRSINEQNNSCEGARAAAETHSIATK